MREDIRESLHVDSLVDHLLKVKEWAVVEVGVVVEEGVLVVNWIVERWCVHIEKDNISLLDAHRWVG